MTDGYKISVRANIMENINIFTKMYKGTLHEWKNKKYLGCNYLHRYVIFSDCNFRWKLKMGLNSQVRLGC